MWNPRWRRKNKVWLRQAVVDELNPFQESPTDQERCVSAVVWLTFAKKTTKMCSKLFVTIYQLDIIALPNTDQPQH